MSAVVAEVAVVVGSQTTESALEVRQIRQRSRAGFFYTILTGGVSYTKVRIIGSYIVDALLFSRAPFLFNLSFCFFSAFIVDALLPGRAPLLIIPPRVFLCRPVFYCLGSVNSNKKTG